MWKGNRVNSALRTIVLLLAAVSALYPAIDGTVVNRTTGKPQPGVAITLVKPGQQGMQTIGKTVSDASGHFAFEKDQPGGGPQLLQASYRDVNYNKLMTPNIPTSNVELAVYEATQSPAVARIVQQMLLIEPTISQLSVSQTVIVQNASNTTYNSASLGGLRFYLPPAANGQVRVSVQGPQGMPLPRPAEKTSENDIFKVDYAIKPGETQFEVDYVLPAGSPFTYRGRIVTVKGMPAGPLRLIAPPGVTFSGTDLQNVGTEPKTQATIYNVLAHDLFSVDVAGTGALRTAGAADADSSDAPPVTQGLPRIYQHLSWLAALAFSILAVGLVYLFISSPIRTPYGK
jgi:hypothetical protein